MLRNTINFVLAIAGYFALPNLIKLTFALHIPGLFIILYVICLFIFSFSISAKLWKWYDQILDMFSLHLRIFDIITWLLMLWFFILKYNNTPNISEVNIMNLLRNGVDGFVPHMPLYLNAYTWGGLTTVGFIFIGVLRLFNNKKILQD